MKSTFICLLALVSLSVSALNITLSRDDRSTGGDYVVLTIKGEGREKSVLITETFFTWDQEHSDTERIFGSSSMICTDWYLKSSIKNVLHSIDCVRDDRPVDGVRNEIVIQANSQGTFDAVLYQSYYSRMTGKEVSETKTLATNLSIN